MRHQKNQQSRRNRTVINPYPFRATKADAALKGKRVGDAISKAYEAALDGAQPMSKNGYKVAAAKGILEEALSSLA